MLNPYSVSSSMLKLIKILAMSIENKQLGMSLAKQRLEEIASLTNNSLPNLSPYDDPVLTCYAAYVVARIVYHHAKEM